MLRMKNLYKGFILLGFTLIVFVGSIRNGIGAVEVFASTGSAPTIRMGDNVPMTRDEFVDWKSQKGIRFFNIDGRIYPASIFFDWGSGKSFTYADYPTDGILPVALRSGVVSNSKISVQEISTNEYISQALCEISYYSPVIFAGLTPIFFRALHRYSFLMMN